MHSQGCLMDDPYIDNTTERSMDEQTRKALELAREALIRGVYYDREPAIAAIDAALAPAAPVAQPLTDEQKRYIVTGWFAEDWAIEKALGMLDDYDRAHGIGQGRDA